MIALLVILSLSFSTKSQLKSCLPLETYKKHYKTDLSECHERIAKQEFKGGYKAKGTVGKVISCSIKTDEDRTVEIAVKIVELLDSELFGLEDHKKMIDNELITLDNINRLENIWLPLYYGCIYDSSEETVYIFMEHLDTTLDLNPNEHTYSDFGSKDLHVKALQVMLQIARGVEGLHGIGMTHNDIRMDNIMLDLRSGVVKLIDFGLVFIADEHKYNKAVESGRLKAGFTTNLKWIKHSSPEDYALGHDIESVGSIFLKVMRTIFGSPMHGGKDSLVRSGNEQFNEAIQSIFEDGDQAPTITDVVLKLEEMLNEKANCKLVKVAEPPFKYRWEDADKSKSGEKADCELLKQDDFSKNYRRKNADKFNLLPFQLRPGVNLKAKEKQSVRRFKALRSKIPDLEETNKGPKISKEAHEHKIMPKSNKNCTGCVGDCRIFRRLLI